jgi:hypothetical protein
LIIQFDDLTLTQIELGFWPDPNPRGGPGK